MTIVNESGLYSLVLGSRKPEAKRFKRWVFDELIPKIKSQQKPHEIVSNGGVQTFKNTEFGEVKTIEENGEVLFCAKDVATALGYKDTINAIKSHCKGVVKRHHLSNGGEQEMSFIPESDLYRLAFGSKLAAAERFTDWVTKDVLPSIRKHGAYMTPDTLENMISSPEFGIRLLTALKDEREKSARLAAQIESDRPKIDYYNTILQCKDAIPISVIAKDYGMSAAQMNKRLNELGIQYKQGGVWLLYQKYADQGYTNSSTFYFINEDGDKHSKVHTRWTQKGRLFLYDALKDAGVVPVCEVG